MNKAFNLAGWDFYVAQKPNTARNQSGHVIKLNLTNCVLKYSYFIGSVLSAARIDRESLAPGGGYGWLNFTLIARDLNFNASRSSKLLVRMRVNDVNDNDPVFVQSFYEVRSVRVIYLFLAALSQPHLRRARSSSRFLNTSYDLRLNLLSVVSLSLSQHKMNRD